MSRHLGRSIRGRMVLAAILIEATMLTLLVANSLRLLSGQMTEQAKRHASQMTPVLQAALIAPLAQGDSATVKAILDECVATQGIAYLAVQDGGGKVVALSGWDPAKPLPLADQRFRLFEAQELPRFNVVSPIAVAGQRLGTVHFGLDLSQIVAAHKLLLAQGVLIALGELLLSTGLLVLVGFWLTRHLTALTRASEAVAMGNLAPPKVAEGPDDVGRLGAAFNAMSNAIAERVQELTSARDIQSALARDIAEAHRRLGEVTHTMGDGLYVLDLECRITFVNPRASEILGWTKDELLGQKAHDLFHRGKDGTSQPADGCPIHQVLQSGTTYRAADEAYARKDGAILNISLVATPIVRDEGIVGAVVSFQDMTEEYRKAQVLKVNEERLGFAIEGSGDGLWDWDIALNTVFYSRTWKEMIGCLPDEIGTGLSEWDSRLHPDDLAATLQQLQKHLEGRSPLYMSEHRFQHKDGTYIWVLDRGRVVERDPQGKPTRMIGTHANISRRKAVEQTLQQRDLLLEAVSHSVVNLLDSECWEEGVQDLLDNLGTASDASRAYLFKRQPEAPEGDEVMMDQVFEWCEGGTSPHIDSPMLRDVPMKAAGYGRWLVELGAGRMICGQVAEFPDSERSLLESQSIQSILAMPVHVRGEWWGFIGFDECKGARVWSFAEQEILRLAGRALGSKIERAETRLELERRVNQRTLELDQKNLDLVAEMEARQEMEVSNRVVMVELEQSRKMESIGRLAAGIAHEINTPTQFLGNNLGFMKDGYRRIERLLDTYQNVLGTPSDTLDLLMKEINLNFLRKEMPQAIDESLEGIDRITKIVTAMKEFSHPGGKEKVPVDLNQCLATTVTVTRNEWKYVSELTLDLGLELPKIHGLPEELNQVFLNLIVNAADAIRARHHATSQLGKINISSRALPHCIEIRVTDDGEGMSADVRKHIYDPFFTTKSVGKGTGQGLTVCYQIVVTRHGGTIQCESSLGQGTTFVIRLPLRPPQVPLEEKAG